jgi:hypothetical protein
MERHGGSVTKRIVESGTGVVLSDGHFDCLMVVAGDKREDTHEGHSRRFGCRVPLTRAG